MAVRKIKYEVTFATEDKSYVVEVPYDPRKRLKPKWWRRIHYWLKIEGGNGEMILIPRHRILFIEVNEVQGEPINM